MDCTNMTAFFKKKGVPTLSIKELFDFITDFDLADNMVDEHLGKVFFSILLNDLKILIDQ